MLSFAKNDRGIRMLSAALLFLPLAALIGFVARSDTFQAITAIAWTVFAAIALIAFLSENAEHALQK